MKATSLQQVVRNFDPKMILDGQDLRFWFVDRPDSPRGYMRTALQMAQQDQHPVKMLLVGHRGSGKSTELNKLAVELAGQYETIGFDLLDIVGSGLVQYQDLMRTLGTRLPQILIERKWVSGPVGQPLHDAWQRFGDWWRESVAGLSMADHEVSTYASFGTLLGEVEFGASISAFDREQLNNVIERRMSDLIRYLNAIIADAQRQIAPKRLLLVIEGLDKVDLESARNVFRDHANTITALDVSMIYTFPLALRYAPDYQTVLRHFDDDRYLHNFAPSKFDGQPNEENGLAKLREIVQKRLDAGLIENDALELLVGMSGGIPSDLVKLIRGSAIYALARDGAAAQIGLSDAQAITRDLRRERAANLNIAQWQVLKTKHRDRMLSNDVAVRDLLYQAALIEYSNGQQWCDVHPLLWSLLDYYAPEVDPQESGADG